MKRDEREKLKTIEDQLQKKLQYAQENKNKHFENTKQHFKNKMDKW